MAAAYRDSISAITSASGITVDPSTLTYSAGDVLELRVHGYNPVGTPSGSDLTWTEIVAAGATRGGPFGADVQTRVFWAVADASITSFTVSNGITDQIGYSLMSMSGVNTSTPVDAAGVADGTMGAIVDPPAPSISPSGSDSLLACSAAVWGDSAVTSFAAPGSMTEREDFCSFDGYTLATEALVSSGATGTRAFVETPTEETGSWIASSVAYLSGGGGGGQGPNVELKRALVRPFNMTGGRR
jgi:hypothetical protein